MAQNFKLRLHNLQLSVTVLFHLAIQRDHLAGCELTLQVGAVKPKAAQPRASLPNRELENRHATGAEQA